MATILLLVTNLFDIITQAAQEVQQNKNLLVLIPSKTRVISCNTDGPLTVHIIYVPHVIIANPLSKLYNLCYYPHS